MQTSAPSAPNEYTRLLLDSSPDGIWSMGTDGLIVFVNAAAVKLFGYARPEDMIGRNSHELVHYKHADGSHYSQHDCPIYKSFREGVPITLDDEVLWRADGTSFHAEYRSVPIMDHGAIVGALVTFFDNTAKRSMQEELRLSQAWLSATLRGIGDAVICTDTNNPPTVTFLNPVAEVLTGWSLAAAKGMPMLEVFNIVHQQTRQPAVNPVARVLREGVIVGLANHTILISRSGKEYIIEDSAAPIRGADSAIQGVVLVFRDVTAQRMLELEQAKASQQKEVERTKLRAIFEQVPIPLATFHGAEHRFTFANSSFKNILLGGREVVGQAVREALPEVIEQGFDKLLDQVYTTGAKVVQNEVVANLVQPDGTIKEFVVNQVYEPMRNSAGIVDGVLAAAVDVTEQVKARQLVEESARRLAVEKNKVEAMIGTSSNGIALLHGRTLIFEKVNVNFTDLVSERDYVGRTWQEVYSELPNSPLIQIMESVFDTGMPYIARAMPIRVATNAGHLEDRHYDFIYSRVSDAQGCPYGLTIECANVSNRLRDQQELEKAKIAAELANETKSAFLANMSHEIRTPLGAMLGYAELLKEHGIDPGERDQFLTIITKNGKALARIIDDILDLAKVEAGKLEIEKVEFSFGELIDDVIDLFEGRVKAKGITLSKVIAGETSEAFAGAELGGAGSLRIASDPTRLRQILINLVGNAVKFTDVGSIVLRVTAQPKAGSSCTFTVYIEDTGIGLTKAQQLRLFQPFVQADNATTRQYGGTGLGLVLSRRLATALGGGITIGERDESGGCTFVVTFVADLVNPPVQTVQLKVDKQVASRRPAGSQLLLGHRLLVADDSPDNQLLMHRYLTREGAQVDLASNGAEAFRMAMSGAYDVVLLDIQMPIMDGYEAARSMREAGYKRPIIALTAHAMAEERARTRAAGCDGHLTKPVDRHELVQTVKTFAAARLLVHNMI